MTYARLDRCNGPPCLRCGCEDAEILQEPKPAAEKGWWGSGRALCRNCGNAFHFKQKAPDVETWMETPPVEHQEPIVEGVAVPYLRTRCPACRSTAVTVTSTRKPMRQHRCGDCGHTFQSRENA